MTNAVDRVLAAVRDRQRVAIFGANDCDGILGTHTLRSVLAGLGVPARAYLPHRGEVYGLSSCAVHKFSLCGADLLIIVDIGINIDPGAASRLRGQASRGFAVCSEPICRDRIGRRLCCRAKRKPRFRSFARFSLLLFINKLFVFKGINQFGSRRLRQLQNKMAILNK